MAPSITYRDSVVNTFRVRPASRNVNNARMGFSDNLKAARLAKGLTQEALALACGWSGQSRIANYESSSATAREPRVSEVPVLARALGVTVAELFGEAASPSHAGRIDPTKLAESISVLRQVAKSLEVDYDPETHPRSTAAVYELALALGAAPAQADVIDFGAKVAEILRKRGGGDDGPGAGEAVGSGNRR